jgi:hypothetical protein
VAKTKFLISIVALGIGVVFATFLVFQVFLERSKATGYAEEKYIYMLEKMRNQFEFSDVKTRELISA